MTVLTIRSYKRYATRQAVRLQSDRTSSVDGLLIELSSEGCRISNLKGARYEIAQPVTVVIDGTDYAGVVRWAHDGMAGVRLNRALHCHEIAGLLEQARRPVEPLRLVS